MKKLIKAIEKMKPFFDAVARNVYLKSIKDGFISCMPIVIFSSIFLLVAYVPNIFGFHFCYLFLTVTPSYAVASKISKNMLYY